VIQEHIKKPLAELVLFGALSHSGGTAMVRVNAEENRLEVTVNEEEVELQDS